MSKRIAAAILTSCFLVACGGGNEANTSKDTPNTNTPSEQTSDNQDDSAVNKDPVKDEQPAGEETPNDGETPTDDQPPVDEVPDEEPENKLPVASIAGVEQVSHGDTIELKAIASDEDGDVLSYQWQQVSGPTAEFSGSEVLKVTLPQASSGFDESYKFALTVTDEKGAQVHSEFEFVAKSLMDVQQAAKLLHRASMGPTYPEILAAEGMSAQEWVDAQIALPVTYHIDSLENYPGREYPRQINRIDAWWKANITAPDQLRQRVAYALSQILVVSDFNNALGNEPKGMVNYYDMLLEHAFGNYRELLEAVSLSPVMGIYLDHLGNEKADTERNMRPDENYARELLQLFSLGLNELNLDGTAKRDDNDLPIPAYTQEHIEGFAKVFTGWTYGGSEFWHRPSNNHSISMEAFAEYHSTAPKHLLNEVLIPENTGPEESLQIALDTIFAHPNIAPFVSKQLILKLVTSNPTPAYVERVANVFNDNGEGIKGDMAAVIKAIYLDAEAQQLAGPLEYFGKVKEPLMKQLHLWRVFDAKSLLNRYYTGSLPVIFGQGPLQATSVFNFYQPDHQPQELSSTSLVAPELQIANDAFAINILNNHFDEVSWRIAERYDELNESRIYLYMQEDLTLLSNFGLNAVIDKYDTLFFAGNMSEEMRQAIYDMDEYFSASESHLRLSYILFLITVSAEYSLQQ